MMLFLVFTLLPAVILAQAVLTTEAVTIVVTIGPVPSAVDITEIFFEAIDQDNDDRIERADVDNYFYNNYDTDGDFEVSFSEFDAYISATRPEMIPIAHAAFNKFDVHQNGFLDDEDFTVAFIAADRNGDDNVSRLEFYTIFEPAFEEVLLDAASDGSGTTDAVLTTEAVTTVVTVGPVPSAVDITEIFFEGIDQDNDDLIERADVDNYFYNNYDTDGDFEVSFNEFNAYLSATRPEMIPIAHAAFNKFDVHQNGFLDDEDLTVAFIAADSNGDDNVSRLEFYTVYEAVFEEVLAEVASS